MPELDHDALQTLFNRLDTTGCIVTTALGEQIDGCFVSFLTVCSMEPPRLLVCTSHENLTHELVEESHVLAVHPVSRSQPSWVRSFGLQTGRDVDKFASLRWRPGITGSPLIEDAMGYIEGRVLSSLDCGDHTARLVEPVAACLHLPAAEPLTMIEVLAKGLDERRPK
jgi:flavin reductase (DIM6/NTAB) family NADH-FMN oxidoreductase RutF